VDWAKVYGSWKQAGYEIDVSLQFESIKPKDWKNLAQDARAYGEAFAKAFGPSSELNLVTSVEVGNEPADYSDETYRTMFENMAKGIRAGDSKMKILTSALLAGKPDQYCKSVNTVKGLEELYDVLNIHVYSMIEGWPTWRRVYPEHPTVFYLQALDEMVIWRDTQAPGKEIWVTEFGYDASTKKPEPKGTFAKWVGSTDTEQAQWLVRSFLIFSSKDIQRAYIYFYDDADKPSFHASSGLTRNFVPKPSYWAVAHLSKTLGDYHFSKIVKQEREEVYAYEYVNPLKPKEPIIVAWRPTDDKKEMTKSFPVTGTLIKAERMPLKEGEADSVSASITDGQVDLTLSETPTYLFLKLP
jgi:serine/threonine-protein kinase ATR